MEKGKLRPVSIYRFVSDPETAAALRSPDTAIEFADYDWATNSK